MEEGKTLAITQLTHFNSNSYWDGNGQRRPQDRYTKWEVQPYIEHGLTQKLTVGGSMYLQQASQSDEKNRGIADPELFLRMNLWQSGPRLISLQPLLKLPSRFEHNDSLPRGGSKSTDLEVSLLYGESLELLSNRDYMDVRLGYRHRNQDLNGQYKMDAAIGISPWEGWQLIPAVRAVLAADKNDNAAFSQSGDYDYNLLKAELTVAYQLPNDQWVQATYFDHLSGIQTGDGNGIAIGYAVRF